MTEKTRQAMVSSEKNDWETPPELFRELDAEFHFTLDPCSTHENALCEKHYTELEDGLAQDWSGETVFCNPPYARNVQDAWVKKCYEEGKKVGTTIVALLPARTDSSRFHNYILGKAEIRFLKGRLSFLDHGRKMGKALFPSMICIWRGPKL